MVWPEPETRSTIVQVSDLCVPRAAKAMARLAQSNYWVCELTYAMGTSMVGKECVPGPLNASVVLRAKREAQGLTRNVVAVWTARGRAQCVCGNRYMPTAKGLFRSHKVAGSECAGSGQPAHGGRPEVGDFAWTSGYVAEGGWWVSGTPRSVNSGELSTWLKDPIGE